MKELYTYSAKELLFILKYRREGLAYEIWRHGTMSRACMGKEFPTAPEKAMPELYEQKSVDISKLPDEFRKMYLSNLQKELNSKYNPR